MIPPERAASSLAASHGRTWGWDDCIQTNFYCLLGCTMACYNFDPRSLDGPVQSFPPLCSLTRTNLYRAPFSCISGTALLTSFMSHFLIHGWMLLSATNWSISGMLVVGEPMADPVKCTLSGVSAGSEEQAWWEGAAHS